MLIPSTKPSTGSMPNTIPSTPQYLPSSSSLAREEGLLKSVVQDKGLGVARAPSGLGLGCSVLLDVALSAKSHEACGYPQAPSASWEHPGPQQCQRREAHAVTLLAGTCTVAFRAL